MFIDPDSTAVLLGLWPYDMAAVLLTCTTSEVSKEQARTSVE